MTEAPSSRVITHFELPPELRRRWSAAALTSFIIATIVTLLLLTAKTVAASWAYSEDDLNLPAGLIGSLLLFTILPIGVGIVIGHVGLVHTWGGRRRGWVLAALGLGAGYLHLLLWVTRVIAATIVSLKEGDILWFMSEFFWWS
jgi:hypothetical protein